ncbi:MAG TPA: 4-oxalocrotonate tautomerase [Candidatus Hydrogenedentes bacterium]|nr:4-oxalocrotonate tautomerase [Candidatus Hydrogenedentota bacterium]
MPNITVEGPPVADLDKKRGLVSDLTDAAANAYGLPRDVMVVLIKENAPENVGVGGQLIVDRAGAAGTT